MGRPWLSADDFNLPLDKITKTLDENLKREIYFKISNNKNSSDK